MATLTLRPTSATGTSWQNVNRVYDGNTSQAATVSINGSNYSQRTLTVDFLTSSIPQNAQITKATLIVIAKQSSSTSSRRITVQADINGSSSSRVIDQQLTSTTNTTLTADIANYMGNLSSLKITGVTTGSSYQSQTFSIYEIYVDVEYQEANVTLTNLTLNTTNEEMEIDDTITLRCTLTPSTANSYNITWSSSNNNVQLTKSGTNCTVRAITSGTSTVTVTDTITGLSSTCTIKIKSPYEDTGQHIDIYLPQQLGAGDKLYWDNANGRYFIQHSTGIIQTEIIQKIEFDTPNPYVKIMTNEAEVAPSSISVELAKKEITDDGGGDSNEIVIGTTQGYDEVNGWCEDPYVLSTDMITYTSGKDVYIKITPTDPNDTRSYYSLAIAKYNEDGDHIGYENIYGSPDCTNVFRLVCSGMSNVRYIRVEISTGISVEDATLITPDDVIVTYKIVNESSGGGDSGGTEQEGDWIEADIRSGGWDSIDEFNTNDYEYSGLYQHVSEVIYLQGITAIEVQGANYDPDIGIGVALFMADGICPGSFALEQVGDPETNTVIVSEVQRMMFEFTGESAIAIYFALYGVKNAPTLRYKLIR